MACQRDSRADVGVVYAPQPQGMSHTQREAYPQRRHEVPPPAQRLCHRSRGPALPPPPRLLYLRLVRFLIRRGFLPGTALLDELLS
jgi:hypothetical protein